MTRGIRGSVKRIKSSILVIAFVKTVDVIFDDMQIFHEIDGDCFSEGLEVWG